MENSNKYLTRPLHMQEGIFQMLKFYSRVSHSGHNRKSHFRGAWRDHETTTTTPAQSVSLILVVR